MKWAQITSESNQFLNALQMIKLGDEEIVFIVTGASVQMDARKCENSAENERIG
jgi:hypothetical protein